MWKAVLRFGLEVFLAGVASYGAGRVEKKLGELLGDPEDSETTLLDEPEVIISCGLDLISDKLAEYVRVKDRLERAESKQKYKQARHLAYHAECARRDLDMLLLGLAVAEGAVISEEFLDEL
jgi:hypothetical protein